MALDLNNVTYKDLDGKFVVLQNVSASGDMYNANGAGYLLFAITNNNVYRITYGEVATPTEGELVVTGDTANKKILWAQDHDTENSYAVPNDSVYSGYEQSAYYGNDLGYPLLVALDEHIKGTYNIVNYDPNIVTQEQLLEYTHSDTFTTLDSPTNVQVVETADGINVTAE